jgi:hypothetical protein
MDTNFHYENYHEKFSVCYVMAYMYLVTHNDGGNIKWWKAFE